MTLERGRALDIIIVTYRASQAAIDCLSELRSWVTTMDAPSVKVTVLDNDSQDGTPERLREMFPEFAVVARGANDGFGVACNDGIRATVGEFVLLLNPDTVVSGAVVKHLVDRLEADPTIGLISPRLCRQDGSFDHASKRNSPSAAEGFKYLSNKHLKTSWRTDYLAPQVGEFESGAVDAINGAFMLTRREYIDRVGLLDEKYWMYGEDLDWCRRFRRKGFSVVYDGTVSAIHLKGASSGSHRSPKVNYEFHRAMWLYFRDEKPSPNLLMSAVVWLGIVSSFVATSVARIVHERSQRKP